MEFAPKKIYHSILPKKNVEIKKKKRQTVKSEYAHKHKTAMYNLRINIIVMNIGLLVTMIAYVYAT